MESALVRLSLFYGLTHTAGAAFAILSLSPLLGHVIAGALLGPPLADLAPEPTGLALAGLAGVWLSVLDAGLAADAAAARAAALRGSAFAVAGIVAPVAGAVAIVYARSAIAGSDSGSISTVRDGETARAAAAAGAALAPTSLGVVAKLLAEHGELETELGRLVSIAAVVDDLLSLILLEEVTALATGNGSAWALSRPIVFAVIFVAGLLILALALPPSLCAAAHIVKPSLRPRASLAAMLGIATLSTWAAAEAGTSFLLAAYLTGIAFSSVGGTTWAVGERWQRSVAPLIPGLLLLFFAATIGFAIPPSALLSKSAVGIGAALGVVGVFGKILCGLLAPNVRQNGLAVGVAMLRRGEFGFLIAAEARRLELLDEKLYGAVIWGVLIPTVVAPLAFGPVYRHRRSKLDADNASGTPAPSTSSTSSSSTQEPRSTQQQTSPAMPISRPGTDFAEHRSS